MMVFSAFRTLFSALRRPVGRLGLALWLATGATGLAQAQATLPPIRGEVRKVDSEAGRITLRHEAITNLDMPPMTMVFEVADRKLLARFKPGDQVRFTADKAGGNFTVRSLEPAGTP